MFLQNKLMLQRALPIHHKLNRIMLEVLTTEQNKIANPLIRIFYLEEYFKKLNFLL